MFEKTKINEEEAGFGPFLKKVPNADMDNIIYRTSYTMSTKNKRAR